MKKLKDQRLVILVDAENLERTANQYYGARIDYQRLIEKLNDRQVIRAIYYRQVNWLQNEKVLPFKRFLEEIGFEIRLSEKNADCWITIDAVTLAEKADTVALVGGDADYLPLIRYLRFRGIKTEVWMWRDSTSQKLLEEADVYVPLHVDILRNEGQGMARRLSMNQQVTIESF